jgi:predicted phosphodiesterase
MSLRRIWREKIADKGGFRLNEETNVLERLPDESDLSYHRRLVYGKLSDKTLADVDYAELSEYVYGQPYSSDVCRRMLYGSKKTLDLIEREVEREEIENMTDGGRLLRDLDTRRIAFEIEKQKFYDQRMAYNKMIRERAREEELNEIIQQCIASGSLPELKYEDRVLHHIVGDNTLLVSLNDIHYGANVDNAWCTYNSEICAEMMGKYLERVIGIADMMGSEDAVVWGAGDFISGNIHRSIQVSNKENVIDQIMGVSELVSQFIAGLSDHFRTVRFISVAGNHSRIEPNKDNAITGERLDNLVEWYLKARLQNFENVIIDDAHRLDNTISVFEVRGQNYCLVHGDFDTSAAKMQALQQMVGVPICAVLSGHMHHNQTNVVQGVRTVMAGSFQGMDSFCVEKRIVGQPEQMVCVCNETGIRCHYDIPLT